MLREVLCRPAPSPQRIGRGATSAACYGRSTGLMSPPPIPSQADLALKNSSYPALRRLSVEGEENALVIWGKVSSYFLKQLAQETVIPVRGQLRLINRVDVERSR